MARATYRTLKCDADHAAVVTDGPAAFPNSRDPSDDGHRNDKEGRLRTNSAIIDCCLGSKDRVVPNLAQTRLFLPASIVLVNRSVPRETSVFFAKLPVDLAQPSETNRG